MGPLPQQFPSPFDALGPHPAARAAALALQEELRHGRLAPGVCPSVLEGPDGGKMFGVLVVRDGSGAVSVLRAFSGTLAGRFTHDGWAPPAFDAEARRRIEPAMESAVKALQRRRADLESSAELREAREARQRLELTQAQAREALRERHRENQRARERAREGLHSASDAELIAQRHHALAQQSRGDKAEKRRLLEAQAAGRAPLERRLRRLERRLAALERLRAHVSRTAMRAIHDTYRLTHVGGQARSLRELFSPLVPPSGAGDCAGVKLLHQAITAGLEPIAMAEFWWGAPPPAGGRVRGAFYPACLEKCGPLIPFLLTGREVAPPRRFSPPDARARTLEIVYEDAHLVAVDKPEGLLSVPGRGEHLTDSVLTRLRARHPGATGPLLVHRLDLDTSGLLIAALDAPTHTALQRQFVAREVKKRYRAVLDGVPARATGEIRLALRGDLHERPRQIHDPVRGKAALTRYEVLRIDGGRAEVALLPHTGRTHQLRVHAAHPLGLGAPIVGDRLYGHGGSRLMLHAERLELRHPATGATLTLESPVPF